ncbi:unnamed protein product [Didymodactylos carnosus]|uniref:Uncharacterized protein n=1 Tax=Didymodactylos carnosus TaxID=1234261 RepID=A0A815KH65_9BILA|nr:unnamed protein product [Didymodactylos carnosus]CAF4287280.1 unnamed protein product [Didymodactylos carnosus]
MYPAESVGASDFACDTTLRNAQFASSLQPIAIPLTGDDLDMAQMLNNQVFTLNVDFINTAFTCEDIIVADLRGTVWNSLKYASCNYSNYILSVGVTLPYKGITIRFTLSDIYLIGGLRLGLTGSSAKDGHKTLQQLGFYQSFNNTGQLLSRNVDVTLKVSKVINKTSALAGGDGDLSGLWIPSFIINAYESFFSETEYLYATDTQTNVTIVISETAYFILNEQKPIAKQTEVIFHTLLFTFVILDIFTLIFLLFKLVFIPLFELVVRTVYDRTMKLNTPPADYEETVAGLKNEGRTTEKDQPMFTVL